MTGSRAGGDPALRPQPCVSRLRPPGAPAAPVAVCGRHSLPRPFEPDARPSPGRAHGRPAVNTLKSDCATCRRVWVCPTPGEGLPARQPPSPQRPRPVLLSSTAVLPRGPDCTSRQGLPFLEPAPHPAPSRCPQGPCRATGHMPSPRPRLRHEVWLCLWSWRDWPHAGVGAERHAPEGALRGPWESKLHVPMGLGTAEPWPPWGCPAW